ncbi:MAG: HYD1 signature containing ADP-ribosyltransferase family protein [Polyangiaceae bacterium]
MTRTLGYDSLGHLVSNVEPNTSSNGTGWLYAYDVSGNLVGTSDARGCGENLVYDGLGRLRWEDYQPCTSSQATYTAAPQLWITASGTLSPTTISGVETLYYYEAPGATLVNNRLTSVLDRGAYTSYAYDGRGRVEGVSRQLASPTWTSAGAIGAANNYDTNVYQQSFVYDGLDRVTQQTTGAAALSGAYSVRGFLETLGGSYGTILQSNIVAADGSPLTSVLGDAASTTRFQCYNSMRWLQESGASRNASLPTCAHAPLGSPTSSVTPPQTVLIDDAVTQFDAVGDPSALTDKRVPAEWGPGALPVNRSYTFDDSYRPTSASFAYVSTTGAVGSDTFVQALPPATAGQTPLPPLSTAQTRVRQQTFAFDWLGNTTQTTDDQNVFFERSLGAITNGGSGAGPNQLTSAASATNQAATTYDQAGNLLTMSYSLGGTCTSDCKRAFSYQWDELGRLAGAWRWTNGQNQFVTIMPDVEVAYLYDAAGNRVLRSSYHEGTGATSYNAEIFPSFRLVGAEWQTGASHYEDDPTTQVTYLVFNGVSYGQVFDTEKVIDTKTLHLVEYLQHVYLELGDTLGSTSAVVDQSTGALVERTTYYPYGGIENDYQSAVESGFWEDYKFTGKEGDNEVGLVYFGARYYSPNLGRWISADPAWVHGLQSDRNPYAYVRGRVTTAVDLLGLDDDVGSGLNLPPIDVCACCNGCGLAPVPAVQTPTVTLSTEANSDPGGPAFVDPRPQMQPPSVSLFSSEGMQRAMVDAQALRAFNAGISRNAPVLVGAVTLAGLQGLAMTVPPAVGAMNTASLQVATRFPTLVPLAGVAGAAASGSNGAEEEAPGAQTLFHYTTEEGMNGILETEQLNPSLKALNPADARYGNGQYLSDIIPGSMTPAQLSRQFLGMPFQGSRFTNWVEIDVSDLDVVEGRPGVFVIPNEGPLDLAGRIVGSGGGP